MPSAAVKRKGSGKQMKGINRWGNGGNGIPGCAMAYPVLGVQFPIPERWETPWSKLHATLEIKLITSKLMSLPYCRAKLPLPIVDIYYFCV